MNEKIINATDETLSKVLTEQKGKHVLVDFWAEWCGPCKMLSPVLDEISNREDIVIVKVDVEANKEIASQYGIRSIPALILFKDGEELATRLGASSTAALNSWIDSNMD